MNSKYKYHFMDAQQRLIMALFRASLLLITLWISMHSSFASAVGLGNVYLKSKLHQPLYAEIELAEIRGLSLTEIFPTLASAADFKRAGIFRPPMLTELKFQTILRNDGTGFIKVTSQRPIEEPFLDFLVEVHWPNGRLLREYTLLMDPPAFDPPITPLKEYSSPPIISSPAKPERNNRLIARHSQRPNGVDPAAPQYPVHSQHLNSLQGGRYKVSGNESLSQISEKARPSGQVSVEQTMIALLRLNPDAFSGYNINRLKKGATLNLPNEATALALTHRQAVWQVAMHHEAWQKRKQLPARDHTNSLASHPSIDSSSQAVWGKARESIDYGGIPHLLQKELAQHKKQVDQLTQENGDLKGQLQNLDQQLHSLNDVVMQQDDQMTAIQSSQHVKESKHSHAKVADKIIPSIDQSSNQIKQAQNTEKVAQDKKEKSISAPQSSYSLFYLVLLLLPIVIGFAIYRRVKNKNENDEELLDLVTLDLENESSSIENTQPSSLSGNPLTDADIHITRGHLAEAVRLLEQTLQQEPTRTDLFIKLLEVHSKNTDVNNFKSVLSRLHQLGDASALQSAEAFKSRFPADTFIEENRSSQEPAVQPTTIADNSNTLLDLDAIEDDFDPGSLDDFALDLNDIEVEPDIDIEINDAATQSIAIDETAAASLSFKQALDADQKPDLDFDTLESELQDNNVEEASDIAFEPSKLDVDIDSEDLSSLNELTQETSGVDFNIDSEDLPSLNEVTQTTSEPSINMEEATIEFDSSDVTPKATDNIEDPAKLDFNDDLDLDDDLALDDELGDLNYMEDNEVSIKLDLAKAYIDMGDKEGALGILDEVLEQGSTEQQAEANELINQI